MKTLVELKAAAEKRVNELSEVRSDIYKREELAIANALRPFLDGLPSDIETTITRGSVYFKMDHPNVNYKKDLFSIYLSETYSMKDEETRYNSVDLSYYSTSVKGVDTWELRRLQLLGQVAEIVADNQIPMLHAANQAVVAFKEEYEEVFENMDIAGKELREIEKSISDVENQKIKASLLNSGLTFSTTAYIELKRNYTVRVKNIKMVDVSKSGKTATVVFEWAHRESTSREENVSVEKIVSQVLSKRSSIAQLEIAE